MIYIESVFVKNLKGINELNIEFDLSGKNPPWTVMLGDNATCKTTAIRAIALALCDEASATALMKESVEGYIRRGAKEAKIILKFRRGLSGRKSYEIRTTIERIKSRYGSYERLRQEFGEGSESFSQGEIFCCAYGAGRGTAGTGDIPGYSSIDSLYNLFNYADGLQNPELTLLRIDKSTRRRFIKIIQNITDTKRIDESEAGLKVSGNWGDGMPLRDLADGYKSTFLWIADLLGWALAFYKDIGNREDIQGVVLVDELDQHLHPKWQTEIVQRLRKEFPAIQFITTTHSPLIAASIKRGKYKTDGLYCLEANAERRISSRRLSSLEGLRIDQVLASSAFDFLTTSDANELDDVLRDASKLASREKELSKSEQNRFRRLRRKIAEAQYFLADTQVERELQKKFMRFLQEEAKNLEEELFE